jgi:spore coat polysaccharide biosynthesis protein SpsF
MILTHAGGPAVDLVTNVQVRTFPRGHSVELINSATFAKLDVLQLSPEEKEHVTRVYYNHPTEFRIINVTSENPTLAQLNFAVDTVEDFNRLEQTLRLRDAGQLSPPWRQGL